LPRESLLGRQHRPRRCGIWTLRVRLTPRACPRWSLPAWSGTRRHSGRVNSQRFLRKSSKQIAAPSGTYPRPRHT
jgi:hypothetical protein